MTQRIMAKGSSECVELSVIVPIYNEEDNIYPLYDGIIDVLEKHGASFEVFLVNDGSTDNSGERMDHLASKDQRAKVIHFRRNFGQTAAMMAGINYSKGKIIIPIDGDLQNDPKDIPKLLEKLSEGYDVCSGWRKDRKDNPFQRTLPSRVANKLISWISGVYLNDYGCTLKAYKKEVIKNVKLYGEMHRFIPIFASWQGARVTEIPVKHYPRIHGQSKYGFNRTFKVIVDLMVVKFLTQFMEKPMHIFGGVGLASIGVSFLSAIAAIYFKYFGNKSFIETPLPLLFVMAWITGIMCFLMGFLAEMIMRTFYESQGKPTYAVREKRNIRGTQGNRIKIS